MIRHLVATALLALAVASASEVDSTPSSTLPASEKLSTQHNVLRQRERRTQDGEPTILDQIFNAWVNARNCFRRASCDIQYNDAQCCGVDEGDKTIFVTSAEYDPNLESLGFGTGIAAADAVCAHHGQVFEGRTFKAWFATSKDDSPNARFTFHRGNYVRPDGQVLYKCYTRLVSGRTPPVSMWMDENGALVSRFDGSTQGAPTNVNEFGFFFDSFNKFHDLQFIGEGVPTVDASVESIGKNHSGGDSSSDDDADFGDCRGFTYNSTRGDELIPSESPVGLTETAFGMRPNARVGCNRPIRFICVEQ